MKNTNITKKTCKTVSFYKNEDDQNKAKERSVKDKEKTTRYKYLHTTQEDSPVTKYIPSPENKEFHKYLDECKQRIADITNDANDTTFRKKAYMDTYAMSKFGTDALLSEEFLEFDSNAAQKDQSTAERPLKRAKKRDNLSRLSNETPSNNNLDELSEFLFEGKEHSILEDAQTEPEPIISKKWTEFLSKKEANQQESVTNKSK